jgi:hypothetical protein
MGKTENSDMPDLNHVNCQGARENKFNSMPMKNYDILNTVLNNFTDFQIWNS